MGPSCGRELASCQLLHEPGGLCAGPPLSWGRRVRSGLECQTGAVGDLTLEAVLGGCGEVEVRRGSVAPECASVGETEAHAVHLAAARDLVRHERGSPSSVGLGSRAPAARSSVAPVPAMPSARPKVSV
jgi:hypothetical protein